MKGKGKKQGLKGSSVSSKAAKPKSSRTQSHASADSSRNTDSGKYAAASSSSKLDLSQSISQSEFGLLVGISQQAVGGSVRSGILKKGAPLGEWLLAYCLQLREAAAGRQGGSEELTQARIDETHEKTFSLRQRRLAEANELIILEDIESAVMEIPAQVNMAFKQAGQNVVEHVRSQHQLDISEHVNSEFTAALRLIASDVEKFGESLAAGGG